MTHTVETIDTPDGPFTAVAGPDGAVIASGWTASPDEALARVRMRARAGGESLAECADCGEPIPEARRLAVAGVTLCIACQTEADRSFRPAGGINRRGSKDSQLK